MAVTPDTTIKLLKVPIEIDNLNQLTFVSSNAQYDYFNSLPSIEEEDLYYQRKDNYISFPAHIDSILDYNYCMYQNSNYSNKWFYAFITNMEYENDGMTRVYIETDTFQTWQFDIEYKASFVEREHVNDDTIGLHTIPENLDIGEVIQEGTAFTFPALSSAISNFYVGIMSSWQIYDGSVVTTIPQGKQHARVCVYNNNVYSDNLYLIHITEFADFKNLSLFIDRTNQDGHINDISNVFIIPSGAIDNAALSNPHTAYATGTADNNYIFSWYTLELNDSVTTSNASITKPTSYQGITLKNNKCFSFPYSYILVSNNAGSNNIYRYEDFSTTACQFELNLAVSIGCSGRLIPKNYKGMIYNEDEALPLGKYPTCAWSGDAYTNWLTQNAVNLVVDSALMVGGLGLSVATAGTSSALAGATALKAAKANMGMDIAQTLVGNVGSTIGQLRTASLLPNITGGQATGDVLWASDKINFQIKCMRAKDEYIKIIDDFFSVYGYKVNSTKIPNITGRTNWNYVKTINCNIEGDIPQEDLQKIKDMFNQGVTLWHNPQTFLDYTQSNTII